MGHAALLNHRHPKSTAKVDDVKRLYAHSGLQAIYDEL